jgi:hypothetical protein
MASVLLLQLVRWRFRRVRWLPDLVWCSDRVRWVALDGLRFCPRAGQRAAGGFVPAPAFDRRRVPAFFADEPQRTRLCRRSPGPASRLRRERRRLPGAALPRQCVASGSWGGTRWR